MFLHYFYPLYPQKVAESQREEAPGPVQSPSKRTELDGVRQQPKDGQVDGAQEHDFIPHESQRGGPEITNARGAGKLEALVPIKRGVYAPHPGGTRWLHSGIRSQWTDLLCFREYYVVAGSSSGGWSRQNVPMMGYTNRLPFQSDLLSMTIYDLANDQEHTQLYNLLLQPRAVATTPVQSSNSPLGK